ncbi:hypothetical protein JIQ42_05984 [Leishmania sp. Namibia]|uniref:hypothetical protein n=1 Tax=Leishmania sp. Namibia TaxID=2802991 RepID=UPI001B627C1C|nr:hypothetical protein JIQ42_05984 [Leishmania sp. Namibia]
MAIKEFDVNLFLKFLFSVVFLFLCCFSLMLYVDKVLALLLVLMLRVLVLPRNIRLSFSGLHIAPLQARVLFRRFSLQTENMSLRIVDGYFTFAFWGFWFRHPRWSRLHEYMIGENLVGTRCRVRRSLHYVKGTIVAVDVEKKKVSVQLDEHNMNGSSLDEDEDVELGEDSGAVESSPDPLGGAAGNLRRPSAPGNLRRPSAPGESSSSLNLFESQNVRCGGTVSSTHLGSRRMRWKEFNVLPAAVPNLGQHSINESHMHIEGLGDEVVKTVDFNDVYIRSRAGLLQLHLNGVRLCLYNATGRYRDLAMAAAADDAGERPFQNTPRGDRKTSSGSSAQAAQKSSRGSSDSAGGKGGRRGGLSGLLQALGKYMLSYDEADLDAHERDDAQESSELRAARKLQEHNILTTSFVQKFFNFIGCVEIEICAAQIDIGSAASSHPYFLHFTFQQGEGRVFLTKDSCPALDLYRSVVELTLREADIRMAQMDSKLSKTQVMRNATLLERARLLVSGVAVPYEQMPFEAAASSELIDEYGIFMDGKNKGTVHVVFYRDAPNVYAGEPVRRGALPTTGVEVLIDAPVLRYGPWLEYCRTQLWQYFLPPNYLPLQALRFEVGEPRPNAGFELLVMCLRATTVEIPFKRRSIVPSPPFGIRDSKRKGMLVATIGEGAQYIQPAFFLLPGEEKQTFESLFIAKNVNVWANCVLDQETLLCNAESLQFFVDRQDDRLWNGRKLWNILAKLSGVKLYWYMVYVDYFLDLLNDWQFSACMYHGVPLSTEMFNTVNRAVRSAVPNVKRFEIFVESTAALYLNANTLNVVYADDPNDLSHNVMAILKMQSASFNMVHPSDQYQLSFENEVARPIEASVHEVRAYLSLPLSHPLYNEISSEAPWAYAEEFRLQGLFTMLVPNQSIPLPRNNLDITTGRTRYHNFFDLDIEFLNLCGTLMGTHIKALTKCFQNLFLGNTYTIAPDELFWLLAKLQSHATTGKNRRKEFKEFLERSQPARNDTEICVTVRLVDVSATVTTGQAAGAPQVSLATGLFTFTYVKQFAVADTAVSLAPLTVRFPDRRGNFPRNAESNIVVGAVTVGLTKHFGRMPLKPKVHESLDVHVGGVSFEVEAEQLVTLVEVAQTVAEHFAAEDSMMEAEVAEALSTAELSAEKVVRSGPLHNTTSLPKNGMRRRDTGPSSVPSSYRFLPVAKEEATGAGSGFADSLGDYVDAHENDCENGAVEMQVWRSALCAKKPPSCRTPATGGDREEGDAHDWADTGGAVVVDAGDRAHGEFTSPLTVSAIKGACAADAATVPGITTGGGGGRVPILHSYESDSGYASSGKRRHGRKRRRRLFGGFSAATTDVSSDDRSDQGRHPFASQVAYDVALEFAKFMEECNRADDDSRDYGLRFFSVTVETVTGVVRIGEDGYASVELPLGVTVAQSTVNDGNSNKRMSVAMKDVGVQLLLSRTSEMAHTYLPSLRGDTSVGTYLEVLSLHTSVCARQYVAYPFDNSLAKHRQRQQQFVEENDYEHLISFPFNKTSTQSPVAPARASLRASAAMAPEGSVDEEAPTTAPRAQNFAASVTEPATLPRPSPQSPTAPPSTMNGLYSPSQQVSAPPSSPPAAREWVPPGMPLPLDRGSVVDATITPYIARAFSGGSPVPSLTSSPDSQDTVVHAQLAREGNGASQRQSTFPSLSDPPQVGEKDGQDTSNHFATCVSVSSLMDSSEMGSADIDSFFETSLCDSSSRRRVINSAFASDGGVTRSREEKRAADKKSGGDQGIGVGQPSDGIARPDGRAWGAGGGGEACGDVRSDGAAHATAALSGSTAAHLFYRTFDKAESDDNGSCAVDYWPPQPSNNTRKVRDRTRFHAQLPIVGFYINSNGESRAPPFFSYARQQMLQREEDLFGWARCVADNRERSQNNSTSRHLHVAFIDPLTLLVTPEAAVLAGTATRLALRVHYSLRGHCFEMPPDPFTLRSSKAAPSTATEQLLLRPRAKKSKARTQQKRWLWEGIILSIAVPTMEAKVLTRLPVPAENLPSGLGAMDGVYTSTIVVRNLRMVFAQNRPPTGEEMAAEAANRMSMSVKLGTIAAITQIEWEPMKREGNLVVKVPGLWYDANKDTIAVCFLTQVAAKVKRDLWRGADGGASNITASKVALHVTRDFADYVHGAMSLVKDVAADVRRRVRPTDQFSFTVSPSAAAFNFDPLAVPREHVPPAASIDSDVPSRGAASPLREIRSLRKGRVVQGKGFVGQLAVTLMDTVRVGQHIAVRQTKLSRLEIWRPFCNFVVVIPNPLRDRNVHIQGIGEIDEVRAAIFPSLLHILHPRGVRRSENAEASTVGSPKPLDSSAPSYQLSGSTPAGTMVFAPLSEDTRSAVGAAGRIDAAEPESRQLAFIYNGTFTVHQLDLRAQQSDTNYLQLVGKDLTGCAESRAEGVASRECVQTEALTETISERLKERLRCKANRARQRAKRSRYPAPPETTELLLLRSTASFFAHEVQMHYVAEGLMETFSQDAKIPHSESSAKQSLQTSKVFSAAVTDVALVAQFSQQVNLKGEQVSLHVLVHSSVFQSPHCLRAAETLHPQVHALISSWRQALRAATQTMHPGPATDKRGGAPSLRRESNSNCGAQQGPTKAQQSRAVTFQMQAMDITGFVGLPQGIVQKFLLPQISCFTKMSSDGRANLKLHFHPFTITAHSTPRENYCVVLPHVYILYAHDPIKMLCNVTFGTIAITITPSFINHSLLTYEKLINDVVGVMATPKTYDNDGKSPAAAVLFPADAADTTLRQGTTHSMSGLPNTPRATEGGGRSRSGRSAGHDSKLPAHADPSSESVTVGKVGLLGWPGHGAQLPSDAKEGFGAADDADTAAPTAPQAAQQKRRQSFLFLLQGVRLSYLTSLTTLRFTIRSLNATAETTEGQTRHTLHWVVHASNAQAALVDRDDHEQMVAAFNSLSRHSRLASRETQGTSGAYSSSRAPSSGRAMDVANTVKTSHPLGGFLWGSVALSFTLSSGKVDENRARAALQEKTSLRSYSEELQKALLDSLTTSTSQWELAVLEPLVVVRFGLDALMKQCVRETEEDIRVMKAASYEADLSASVGLRRHKRFQRLQEEKKRIDKFIQRAERARHQKLRNMTERVVDDVAKLRGMLLRDTGKGDFLLDFFKIRHSHRVVASVRGFMVVLPFGDAAYRSILEELPGTFACGKTDRHMHTASCLNRRRFIPSLAFKTKVNDISFICNVEVVKHIVPVLVTDQRHRARNGSMFVNAGTADQDYTTSLLFYGRLLALNSHFYFTDGSPLGKSTTLPSLLRDTPILGGQGELTSYAAEEHRRSLNSVSVVSVEAPLRIEKRNRTMRVGVVVDVSGPKARVSSRILSIVSELSQEQAASPLQGRLRAHGRTHMPSPTPFPSRNADRSADAVPRRSGSGSQRVSGGAEVAAAQPESKEPLSLHLDVTGRLEASELAVFSYANPDGLGAQSCPTSAGAAGGGAPGHAYGGPRSLRTASVPVTRRRVSFETPSSQNNRILAMRDARGVGSATGTCATGTKSNQNSPCAQSGGGIDFNSDERFLIMSIPLPGVTLRTVMQRGRGDASEDVTVARVEVRAGTIELSPCITALAREVEMCANSDEQYRVERNKKIIAFVQSMEAEVPQLRVPLHCPLVEVLVPMPRAYQSVLSRARMDHVVRLQHADATAHPRNTFESGTGTSTGAKTPLGCTATVVEARKSRGIIAVHVSISDLRLIFNSEPVASTHFMLYLDQGGTINFVFKRFERPEGNDRFVNKFPDASLVMAMRRLRAECQTKLEVKSLEVTLPEAELTISRRSGHIGVVDTVTLYFPFNAEGSEPNLTVRLQHVSQLFLVFNLWSITTSETLKTARRLFRRGAAGREIAKQVASTQLGRRATVSMTLLQDQPKLATDRRTLFYLGLSRAVCFFDLGAGSTHRFTIGAGNVVTEVAKHANGCSVSLLLGRISSTSIRSEGVLSGGMMIGDVMTRAFLIQNTDGAEVFVRSPDQRTFREALLMQQVHVNFKERQLKDVFECKVGSFRGNSMDGIGEEEYTTTDMDVLLHRGTLGVTPSTVPAFLGFVRNISAVVAEQRRIAATRMTEKTAPLPSLQSTAGRDTTTVRGPQGPLRPTEDRSTESHSGSVSEASVATQKARARIPFMGNTLLRVPCGQVRVGLEETTVLLGAIASGEAAVGCVVLSFPKARLSFAECPCDDYSAAKKALVIESHNVEVYRPGTPRVVVMGFQGVNHFEFYTRQVLGSAEVGFSLTLRQTHPWTGNPRFRDFEEMISLIKSFTDKKNADVFQHFGRLETVNFSDDTPSHATRPDSGNSIADAAAGTGVDGTGDGGLTPVASGSTNGPAAVTAASDPRTLKALRSSKFSPQLRFGGDVSVNTEVILNWLGVTEKMLPHAVHTALCDKLEKLLCSLSDMASERLTSRSPADMAVAAAAAASGDAQPTSISSPPPLAPSSPEARRLDF